MSDFKAVLFDMDGVLVDSMKYHAKSYRKVLQERDMDVDTRELYKLEGEKERFVFSNILERRDEEVDEGKIKEMVEKKEGIFEEIENTKVFPGMEEVVKDLKKLYKVGLVSGSRQGDVMKFVQKYFDGIFDYVISADNVENGKPSPEPYLKAVEFLNVDKEEALVIENSPLGVESAKRAGIKCIAVASYLPESELSDADKTFKNHEELISWIRENLL